MKKINLKRRQTGFTLVELSVVLVVVGLLFAAVVKGQEMVDVAKAQKLVQDLKNTESIVQKYALAKGRMPGDCDSDGVVDFAADVTTREDGLANGLGGNKARADKYNYTTTQPTYAATVTAADDDEGCLQVGALVSTATLTGTDITASTIANTWINDLKLAGMVSDSVPNRIFAKTVNEDFMFLGSVQDRSTAATGGSGGAGYNAIVLHNVPQWMARAVATAINGTDAVANRGRIRQLVRDTTNDADGRYELTWDVISVDDGGNMRDSMVSIVYFYDRVPAVTGTVTDVTAGG
jgi:prepilin-type N-terminal cleavage/methylation domain-containing protein